MEKKLTVGLIISEGLQTTLKNIGSILLAVILWFLTAWIPYLNVGTTIALLTMPIEISKGRIMSPTAIFDPKYRQNMGEFFILGGLMSLGISIGYMFMAIPGIVIAIAWSLSFYLFIDKGLNPMDSITKSNQITNGYKWTIFGGKLVLGLIPWVIMLIGSFIGGIVAVILSIIALLFFMPMMISADAVIYKTLVVDAENPQTNTQVQ